MNISKYLNAVVTNYILIENFKLARASSNVKASKTQSYKALHSKSKRSLQRNRMNSDENFLEESFSQIYFGKSLKKLDNIKIERKLRKLDGKHC